MNRMYVQCLFLPACLFPLGLFIVLDLYNDGWMDKSGVQFRYDRGGSP